MTQVRIFKIGSRVETRGLISFVTGTVVKIGRDRATVKMDDQFVSTTDARGRAKKPVSTWAYQYKNLRLIEAP